MELRQLAGTPKGADGKAVGASFIFIVQDSGKVKAFYRDQFDFAVRYDNWRSDYSSAMGTPGAQIREASIGLVTGRGVSWTFFEFKGVDRKPYAPRIPDRGAPAVGLEVHDIDAAIAAVKAAGGSSITQGGSLRLGGNGKVGFVRDPSGTLVELAQP